jgi:hypothetical protein
VKCVQLAVKALKDTIEKYEKRSTPPEADQPWAGKIETNTKKEIRSTREKPPQIYVFGSLIHLGFRDLIFELFLNIIFFLIFFE